MYLTTDLQTSGDGPPEVGEKGIKQLLQMVVDGSLDWQSGHCDAINMHNTKGKEIQEN